MNPELRARTELRGRFFEPPAGSFFLVGPRGTGKTIWLRQAFPDALMVDVLVPEVHRALSARPERLAELVHGNRQKRRRGAHDRAYAPSPQVFHPAPPPPDGGATLAGEALTRAGGVVGTPRYMRPEQARGEAATAASDMFAFGLLLFELHTGKAPYDSDSLARVLQRARPGDP